ncbi:replication initiator [Actinophytocola xanthii]|uniref:replication initiator n=1 Tax=Actinophytocola xanthii TaxID=1912961 RepID=UPI000AF55622
MCWRPILITFLDRITPVRNSRCALNGRNDFADGRRAAVPRARATSTPILAAAHRLAEALNQVDEPAHVVAFGRQVHSKRHLGQLGRGRPAHRRQRAHHDRLHDELRVTPCSPRCGVAALRHPTLGSNARTHPSRRKGRAHRRTTLGLPGRRVLVSRMWSG